MPFGSARTAKLPNALLLQTFEAGLKLLNPVRFGGRMMRRGMSPVNFAFTRRARDDCHGGALRCPH